MSELFTYIVIGLSRGLVYGVLALGLVLVYKGTKILNLAQPFFGLLGAFVAWWLTAEAGFLPFEAMSRPRMILASILTIGLIGLHGYSLERTLFHRLRNAPRLVTLVATLAIGQGTVGLVTILFSRNQKQAETLRIIPTGIRQVVELGDVNLTGGDLQVILVVPLVALGLAAYFKFSRFGVAIRAAADNGDAARLLGVSVDRVAAFTWATGAALAALAGILLAAKDGSLAPTTLSTGFLVKALAAALIGGLTSFPGALVGGLIVGIGESTISGYFSDTIGAADIVFFAGVVAMLAFRPQGIFGQRDEAEDTAAFVPAVRELPRRLQRTAYPLLFSWAGKATFVFFALAVSWVTGSATNDTLVQVMIYSIVGISLTVLMGYTGQISLGHWALVGFGAFAAANLYGRFNVPFLIMVPMVFVIGSALSLVIGLPALRIKGLYLAVVTVTFSYAAELFLFKSDFFGGGTTGRAMPRPKIGPLDLNDPSNRPKFVFTLILLLISMVLARNVLGSRVGRAFVSLRENEKAAATLGVRLAPTRLLAFALSGGIAALAGVAFAVRVGTVSSRDFPTQVSLVLVLMAIIGGLPTLSGPILGAFIVFGLPFLLKFDNAWIIPIGTGILTIIVITRLPGGLGGILVRTRQSMIETLVEIEEGPAPVEEAPVPVEAIPSRVIVADGLSRSFGGHEAVNGVTFRVEPGEVVGLLGPNGAGKTTTIRMLLGLLRPHGGSTEITRPLGYLPEQLQPYDGLTVRSYLRFWSRTRGIEREAVDAAMADAKVADLSARPIGRLSKGQRQRVAFAQAILGAPRSIVLDEPTASLDPKQVVDVRKLVRRRANAGAAVLVSTHVLSEAAAVCDRVVVLGAGRVVAVEPPGNDLERRFLDLTR